MPNSETLISPPKGLVSLDWREFWSYRDLFLVLAWRDVSVRYKQTVFGVLWALLQPLLTMFLFSFLFNRVAGIQSGDGTPYPIFVYVGQLLWLYFSGVLNNSSQSLVANAPLMQKVYFPRLIIPVSSGIVCLVDLAVAATILIGMLFYYGLTPQPLGLLLLPFLVGVASLCAMGWGLFLSALNVKYRDVRYALPFFIQILMYVSPVIYPVKLLDHHPSLQTLMLWLNPISGVIESARAGLLGKSPLDLHALTIASLMSVVYFCLGLYYFRRTERYFADIA